MHTYEQAFGDTDQKHRHKLPRNPNFLILLYGTLNRSFNSILKKKIFLATLRQTIRSIIVQ